MLIQVAVAVIINQNNEILIAKRDKSQDQGNKWEFPGGKIEGGETRLHALKREIFEELDIEIQSATEMLEVTHEYIESDSNKNKTVTLAVFEVREWQGEPRGAEGQPIRWIKKTEFDDYEFPAANADVISRIRSIL